MSVSLHPSSALPEERASPVPVEAAQRMLDYLIFHRSLIDDSAQADSRRALLSRYMALVQDLREGVHVIIEDPVEKATALLFELVMDEEFDPWEIDLVRFTQTYLERIRGRKEFDFAVSGRLVYMAWSILYLQSRVLLQHSDALRPAPLVEAPTAEDGSGAPEALDDGYLGELTTPEAVAVTSAVLENATPPPLEEMIRHSETRPVSLLELVRAFGEAEVEARRSLRIEELRERLREQQRAPPEVIVHGDIPERDLADAWEVCLTRPRDQEFPFLALWRSSEGPDRLVALFLAVLFLVRENVIDLKQPKLGSSPLMILRTADTRPTPAKEV
jgi:segregation and condensation protein A